MSRSASCPIRRTPLGESAMMLALLRHVAGLLSSIITWRRFWKSCCACCAQQLAQIVDRDVVEVARHQVLLELLHPLHLAHQVERLLVVEALGAVEHVLVAVAEILQVADVLVLA